MTAEKGPGHQNVLEIPITLSFLEIIPASTVKINGQILANIVNIWNSTYSEHHEERKINSELF